MFSILRRLIWLKSIRKPLRVCIDPGHGWACPHQAIGVTGTRESVVVLSVAEICVELARERGWQIELTRRTVMGNPKLSERVSIAEAFDADCIVSIHCNWFSSPRANGYEVWCEDFVENRRLADAILDSAELRLSNRNRGTKLVGINSPWDSRFPTILSSTIPDVIVELGFLSNPEEEHQLNNTEFRRRWAEAIVGGVHEWSMSR